MLSFRFVLQKKHCAASSVIAFLVISLFLLLPTPVTAASPSIHKLKDLHLTTTLVDHGDARSVIVAPANARYDRAVALVQEKIRNLTGITLPVCRDDTVPEEILRTHHVIALGNMATNRFIEKLYRQWQVILDLKYPGEGGYVVRSLHNPFGTGRNVVFLGGSDDAGVVAAAQVFVEELRGRNSVKIGWMMKISLGKGLTPPVIGSYLKNWQAFSWNDSWRRLADGRTVGSEPCSYFGWNAISVSAALYYMTGQKEYLQTFRELAMPDPGDLSLPNRTSDAFTDPTNPLVKSYHYRSHLLDCLYDLIEESPQFTDAERLKITNKLLEHQYELDSDHSYSAPNGDRHALWHMLSMYTGSRYFARSYPDPVWTRRLGNVRKAFHSFINNPTWGERDTLEWVSTSIEPIFDFFLLDGDDQFVTSGTAATMMRALEVLMNGREVDDYDRFLSLNLLHKAAWLLKDGRYIWMARQVGFDLEQFRIGQSYWPAPDLDVHPPNDLVNRVAVTPVARSDWEAARTPVRQEDAFQLLAFRTGLERTDDYFAIDGYNGLGRHPYQLNTLYRLRMFGGKDVLSGYGNDLAVTVDGVTGAHVALSAALKQAFVAGDTVYVRTEVPDMPGSRWQRHLLYLKDRLMLVVDGVTASRDGEFDLTAFWQTQSSIKNKVSAARQLTTYNGAALASADYPMEKLTDTLVRMQTSRVMHAGEEVKLATMFYQSSQPKTIRSLKSGGYFVGGSSSGFVTAGALMTDGVGIQAAFSYFDRDRVVLVNGERLAIGGQELFTSDGKVSFVWDLRRSSVIFSAPQAAKVTIVGKQGLVEISLPAGDTAYHGDPLLGDIRPAVQAFLLACEKDAVSLPEQEKHAPTGEATWSPVWRVRLPGRVTRMVSDGSAGRVWVASQEKEEAHLARLSTDGAIQAATKRGGEILSLWSDRESGRKEFSLLAGFRDDTVRAFADTASEMWSFKAQLHPVFRIGDRYEAPWFTDPNPPYNMRGVYSIAVGDFLGNGSEQIAVGRPCTIEVHGLDGVLLDRVPTRWGTNTSLALLDTTSIGAHKRMLLAGKENAGIPGLSAISPKMTNVSDDLFWRRLPPGYLNMHAWQQRGTRHLLVEDLEGNGEKQVIFSLSGHWNELRVYEGATGKPHWVEFLGPDKGGAPFMAAATVVDLDGDGKKEVLVGTKTGWVLAFDAQGKTVFRKQFGSPITAIAGNPSWHGLAVATTDGTISLLDAGGNPLRRAKLRGAPTEMVAGRDWLMIGDSLGNIERFDVSP